MNLNTISQYFEKNDKLTTGFFLLIIITIGLLIYGRTSNFDYNLDDHLVKINNTPLHLEWNYIKHIFNKTYDTAEYRPISILSFYLETLIFKTQNSPKSSHIINTWLYIFICFQVFFYVSHLLKAKQLPKQIAYVTTLLFLCHPIHSEVVANIKCRDNLLSLSLSLISLHLIIWSLVKNRATQLIGLIVGLIIFFVALMAKRDSVFLIFIVPITIVFLDREKIFLGIVSFISFLISFLVFEKHIFYRIVDMNVAEGGFVRYTENPTFLISNYLELAIIGSKTFWLYMLKLIVPINYYYYYGFNQINISSNLNLVNFSLIIGTLLLAVWLLFFTRKYWLKYSFLFIAFSLLYCLNIIQPVAGIIALRYSFIASLGFSIGLAFLLYYNFKSSKKISFLMITTILSFYLFISIQQTNKWATPLNLVEKDSPHLLKSHEAQRIAAQIYLALADSIDDKTIKIDYLKKGLTHTKKANLVFAENPVIYAIQGLIHFNLSEYDSSAISFLKAFDLDTTNYDYLEYAGESYYLSKKHEIAIEIFTEAFNKSGNQELLNKTSTIVYESLGEMETRKYNQFLHEKYPKTYAPFENLAYLEIILGDTIAAKNAIKTAIDLGSNDMELSTFYHSIH
jgi:tetratricopeptide (TPR) repeat protein